MFRNMSHGSVTGARTSSCNIIFNIMLKMYVNLLYGRRSHLRVTCSECDLKAGPQPVYHPHMLPRCPGQHCVPAQHRAADQEAMPRGAHGPWNRSSAAAAAAEAQLELLSADARGVAALGGAPHASTQEAVHQGSAGVEQWRARRRTLPGAWCTH